MKHLSAVLESQCDISPTDPALSSVKELDDSFQQLLLKIRFQQQQQRQQAENDGFVDSYLLLILFECWLDTFNRYDLYKIRSTR